MYVFYDFTQKTKDSNLFTNRSARYFIPPVIGIVTNLGI